MVSKILGTFTVLEVGEDKCLVKDVSTGEEFTWSSNDLMCVVLERKHILEVGKTFTAEIENRKTDDLNTVRMHLNIREVVDKTSVNLNKGAPASVFNW